MRLRMRGSGVGMRGGRGAGAAKGEMTETKMAVRDPQFCVVPLCFFEGLRAYMGVELRRSRSYEVNFVLSADACCCERGKGEEREMCKRDF
jgi:hypothetical protein